MALRNLFGHRPKTAFVLGGGGNLGAVQVGQLRALLEGGVVPDVIVGCSVGALNGALIAGEPSPDGVGRLTELWRGLDGRRDVFPTNGWGRGPWVYVRNGLSAYSDDGLRNVIETWLPYRRFEEARVPLWVVATSLRTGLEHWFSKREVVRPLLASTALPGVFPPVPVNGEHFIDGGVVNNVPMSKAFELRAKRVFVLDCGNTEREWKPPKRPYEVLMQAVSIARAYRVRIDEANVPDGIDYVRMPSINPGRLRYDDFSRSDELIELAYEVSRGFLGQAGHKAA